MISGALRAIFWFFSILSVIYTFMFFLSYPLTPLIKIVSSVQRYDNSAFVLNAKNIQRSSTSILLGRNQGDPDVEIIAQQLFAVWFRYFSLFAKICRLLSRFLSNLLDTLDLTAMGYCRMMKPLSPFQIATQPRIFPFY